MVMVMVMFRWLSSLPWAGQQLEAQVQQALGLVPVLASVTRSISTNVRNQKFFFLDQSSDYL